MRRKKKCNKEDHNTLLSYIEEIHSVGVDMKEFATKMHKLKISIDSRSLHLKAN